MPIAYRAAVVAALGGLCLMLTAHAQQDDPPASVRVTSTAELLEAYLDAEPGTEFILAPGTYTGPFGLDKSVHVRAEILGETFIEAPGDGNIVFFNEVGESTLEGLTFRHTPAPPDTPPDTFVACISVYRTPILIKNCRFENSPGHGLNLNNESRVTIEDSIIENCSKSGLYVWGDAQVTVRNSAIKTSGERGIFFAETGARVELIDSEVRESNVDGVYMNNKQAMLTATGTQFVANGWSGVNATGGADIRLEDCDFLDNGRAGVRLVRASPASAVENSRMLRNLHGVSILWSEGATITNCDISDNRHHGIVASYPGTDMGFVDCRITQNGFRGVNVGESARITLENCEVANNVWEGIATFGEETEVVLDNTPVTGNGEKADGTNEVSFPHGMSGYKPAYRDFGVLWTLREYDLIGRTGTLFAKTQQVRDSDGYHLGQEYFNGYENAFGHVSPRSTERVEEWLTEWEEHIGYEPGSGEPHPDAYEVLIMTRAMHHKALAWDARGGGYMSTVTDEGYAEFQRQLGLAQEWIKRIDAEQARFAQFFEMLVDVHLGRGYNKAQARKWVDMSRAIDPGFMGAAYSHAWALMPRWYGVPGDVEAFALDLSKESEIGDEVYARLATNVLNRSVEDYVWQEFDYERLKRGLLAFLEKHPENIFETHGLCFAAALAEDLETAQAMYQRFGGDFDHSMWRPHDENRMWMQYVEGDAEYPGLDAFEYGMDPLDLFRTIMIGIEDTEGLHFPWALIAILGLVGLSCLGAGILILFLAFRDG